MCVYVYELAWAVFGVACVNYIHIYNKIELNTRHIILETNVKQN